MKFQVSSKVTKFKPTKKFLLIAGASLLVLAVIVVSLAAYQVSKQNKAEAAKKAQEANTALITGLQKQVKTEQDKNKVLESQKAAACSNYKALSTARATRSLVIVPTAVGCPQ